MPQNNNKNASAQAKAAERKVLKAEKKAVVKATTRLAKREAKLAGQELMSRAAGGNDYIRCLVNPEQFQSPYPDDFCDKTAVCKFIFNKNIEWDSSGNWFAWINPTLKNQVYTTTTASGSVQFHTAKAFTGVSTNAVPTFPGTCPNLVSDTVLLSTKKPAEIPITPHMVSGVMCQAIQLYQGFKGAISGNLYLNWPAGDGVTWQYQINGSGTWTSATSGNPIALASATNVIIGAITTGGTGAASPTTLSIGLNMSGLVNQVVISPFDNDYLGDLLTSEIFEEYRVVGMSTLVTYEGDTLYNGGNISGRVVNGGQNPFELGWLTYSDIAELPESYERPMTMGAYNYWLPTDTKDMYFRDVDTTNADGDLPSFIVAGTVKNTANAVLRLRVCMVVEAKTYKPYVSTSYSVVDRSQIDAAVHALQGLPRVMENPLHLEDIRKFLRKVVQTGQQIYSGAKAAAPYVVPLAKMAGSFLL